MNISQARDLVNQYLQVEEKKVNEFGCALPNYVNPNIKLVIDEKHTKTHDFGWVFYFNDKKFIETNNWEYALGGNAPIIVDKARTDLIHTGTAHPIEYYVNNYLKNGDPFKE
ncbi:hypothetical protein J7384_16660 [Endozoicomonas sp. G2_1]|uniref:YrhB domain-containing protein n=1 Tax=Endozoicomonas sp. G2_1 TaxID=2821091 RepID=UPI001ADAF429|nr:YrhB domain-containing protein [Endozoicomonas sp. G2_1]MBO9491994.1 hypothetical protein [Endozoicomonas sp. G2_1]